MIVRSRCPNHHDIIVDAPPGSPILCPHNQLAYSPDPSATVLYSYTEAIPENEPLFPTNRVHDRPDF